MASVPCYVSSLMMFTLRVCVEKLQLLDTPEERQRRLSEIPEVHADAKMNPDYESEQDVGVGDQKQDEYVRSKPSEFGRSKHRQINGKRKVQDNGLINGQRGIAQKRCASNLSNQAGVRPRPEIPAAIIATGSSSPANDGETEKLWHYRDPNGNIQGPFSMVQIRKWSTTGYFPPNMRIWRSHEQKDSVLLTDVLKCQTAPHKLSNLSRQSKQIRPDSDNQISDAKRNHETEIHGRDRNQIIQPLQYGIAGTQLEDNNKCRRIDVSGSLSSGFSASTFRHKEIQPKDLPPVGLKENKSPSIHTGVGHPIPLSNNGPHVSNHHGVQGYGNVGSPLRYDIQIVDGHSGEKKSNKTHQTQTSGQNGISSSITSNSTKVDLYSGSPLANAGSCKERYNTEPHESLNSALKVNSQELEFVTNLNLQSSNPKAPPQTSDIPSLPSPTPKILNENQGGQMAESEQHQPGNGIYQDSGHSCSTGSNLVVGGTQLPDKIDDRGEHSPLANAGSCGEMCNTEPNDSLNSALKVNSQELEFVAAVELQSSNSKVPPQASDIPSLPSPTPEILNENQGGQIAESNQPQPGHGMVQDSGPRWCSGSSLGVDSTQLPDKTDDWIEHSPTPAKPKVEGWSSGPVSMSLLKQSDVVDDHATPASNDDTLAHNSPSHITSNVTSWHGVETIEFTTLGEESVSDLLDEVDAMESRRGLGSPTSTMTYGDAMKGFKNDCFFIDDLSLTLDPGKGDAWSSTGDIQVNFPSIPTKDTCDVSGSDGYDPLKRSSRHSCTSSDVEARAADFSHNQVEVGLASHPCPSRDISQGLNGTTMPPDNKLEAMENVIKKTGDHMNFGLEPSAQGVTDVYWDSNQGAVSGSDYGGHQWDGNRRSGGERHPNSRDWESEGGGEVEYDRDMLLGNRQPLHGGGGFWRAPLKGQHVCKFNENGHCKKGASCGYLHP